MTKETSPIPLEAIAKPDAQSREVPSVRLSDDGDSFGFDQTRKKQSTPDSSYQKYLFGSAGTDERPAWSDSMKGRAAIRVFSRGIVGAAFFTIGGRMAHNQLKGYNRNEPLKWKTVKENPLQFVAKTFDVTFGNLIEGSVKRFAKAAGRGAEAENIAKSAVTFRSTRFYEGSGFEEGRSYGAEVVGFTFDFAMASIGDALTRNIIQAIDPNVKKSWHINDKGEVAAVGEKYHTDFGKLGKHILSTGWRILSKNQGEDWAAAIPYAYQMKFQRQFLSSIFNGRHQGHKIAFDHSWNGGAFKINAEGKIIGDYQLAGAIDLHARFVGYNWYTLMFREAYDTVGNAFNKWKEDGFAIHPHWPDKNPLVAAVDGVGSSLRYITKSFIKANMYMNPAVIPFWLVRVPQSKWRSGLIYQDPNNDHKAIATVPGMAKETFPPMAEGLHLRKAPLTSHLDLEGRSIPNPLTERDPYSWKYYEHYDKNAETLFSKGLNWIGKGSYKLGTIATKYGERFLPRTNFFGDAEKREKFMREYVDASLSYTPYMWAKAEAGLRVDDTKGDGKPGQMDLAIYRFIDDVAGFNFKAVPQDLKKMWKLGTNFEREIKLREGEDNSQQIAKKPKTTVHASSLNHDPVSLERAEAANESRWVKSVGSVKQVGADVPSANDEDHRWTKMVANGDYHPSQFHSGGNTRH